MISIYVKLSNSDYKLYDIFFISLLSFSCCGAGGGEKAALFKKIISSVASVKSLEKTDV